MNTITNALTFVVNNISKLSDFTVGGFNNIIKPRYRFILITLAVLLVIIFTLIVFDFDVNNSLKNNIESSSSLSVATLECIVLITLTIIYLIPDWKRAYYNKLIPSSNQGTQGGNQSFFGGNWFGEDKNHPYYVTGSNEAPYKSVISDNFLPSQ